MPTTTRRLILYCLAAISGLMLFASDFPAHMWGVQLVALLPLLVGLVHFCPSKKDAALAGMCLGLFMLVPLALVLEFPAAMAAGLALYMGTMWILMSLGIFLVIKWPSPAGALAAGAVAALVEWVDISLLPIWGTAQVFTRVWSAAPVTIQLTSITGVTGLVFVLFAAQALVARLITHPAGRRRDAAALIALTVVVMSQAALTWPVNATGSLRVAALGWTSADIEKLKAGPTTAARMSKLYEPLLEQAVQQEARLVVSPEVGFWVRPFEKAPFLDRLSSLSRKHQVALVVGFFDREKNENRLVFYDTLGELKATYSKTHLIPMVENYTAGTGELAQMTIHQGRRQITVGGMICQDDNFTDLARGHGRLQTEIVAVPTNDWRQVMNYHLENSIFRAVENRYGIVRAATNGISAIISPRGEVLARADHFEAGHKFIVANMPLVRQATIYSQFGEWLAAICALGLVWGFVLMRRRKSQ